MDDAVSQPDAPPALNVGDRVELTIDDMAFGGEGVGRIDGFVIFVPFVITGEIVLVEITEKKKAFARAKPLQVLEASAERVEPRCEYFGTCGGCQYQHVDYEAQKSIKESQVRDLFERIGGFESSVVGNLVPCPEPYNYRNRIMVRRQWNKIEQRPVYGFLHWDSRLVIDLQNCHIAEPALNEQLQEVRENPPPRRQWRQCVQAQRRLPLVRRQPLRAHGPRAPDAVAAPGRVRHAPHAVVRREVHEERERDAAPFDTCRRNAMPDDGRAGRERRDAAAPEGAGEASNHVDGDDVPVPHFGLILGWEEWHELAERLRAEGVPFVVEPHIRFKGKPGEQATMFFRDPSGNAIEIKSFQDEAQIFAK